MQARTIRFRENSVDEMSALNKLKSYRKYGFKSGEQMIIAAINQLDENNTMAVSSGPSAEEIADAVAKILSAGSQKVPNIPIKQKSSGLEKALSFIDEL